MTFCGLKVKGNHAVTLRGIIVTAGLVFLPWAALPLRAEEQVYYQVKAVSETGSLMMENGWEIRPAAIGFPAPAKGQMQAEPQAQATHEALKKAVLGQHFRLEYPGKKRSPSLDRRGRHVAYLYDEKGRMLQEALLAEGIAMVRIEERDHLSSLLAAEAGAQQAKRGIWQDAYYGVLSPDEAAASPNRFARVRGKVVSVSQVRGVTYLNFGEDWKKDFSITIAKKDAKAVPTAGLTGKWVIARGYLYRKNGPMMDVMYPEQLRVTAAP